jgi:hypothetical protein
MRTPEQCMAKAEDLEREADGSATEIRRKAYMDLARHWRRLAERHDETPAVTAVRARRHSRAN